MKTIEEMKGYAKTMRRQQTFSEQALWRNIRKSRTGVKIRRQVIIGPFIVDFYSPTRRVAIEVDGPTHDDAIEYDKRRDDYLARFGIQTIRFKNADVMRHPEMVVEQIRHVMRSRPIFTHNRPPQTSNAPTVLLPRLIP